MPIAVTGLAEEMLRKKLSDSQYATAEDLVLAGLKALFAQEQYQDASADFRAKVQAGLDSADRGELSDGDAFFAELERDAATEIQSG